jgi:hypothetical protein
MPALPRSRYQHQPCQSRNRWRTCTAALPLLLPVPQTCHQAPWDEDDFHSYNQFSMRRLHEISPGIRDLMDVKVQQVLQELSPAALAEALPALLSPPALRPTFLSPRRAFADHVCDAYEPMPDHRIQCLSPEPQLRPRLLLQLGADSLRAKDPIAREFHDEFHHRLLQERQPGWTNSERLPPAGSPHHGRDRVPRPSIWQRGAVRHGGGAPAPCRNLRRQLHVPGFSSPGWPSAHSRRWSPPSQSSSTPRRWARPCLGPAPGPQLTCPMLKR